MKTIWKILIALMVVVIGIPLLIIGPDLIKEFPDVAFWVLVVICFPCVVLVVYNFLFGKSDDK